MATPQDSPMTMVYVPVRLDQTVADRIEAIAEAARRATGKMTNRSHVIRLALDHGLDQAEQELTS